MTSLCSVWQFWTPPHIYSMRYYKELFEMFSDAAVLQHLHCTLFLAKCISVVKIKLIRK